MSHPHISTIVASPFSSQVIVLSGAKMTGYDLKQLIDEDEGLNIMEEEKTKKEQ